MSRRCSAGRTRPRGTVAAAALRRRDAVVIDRDEQLRLALEPHERELPERHEIAAGIGVVKHEILREAPGDERGNLRQAALTAARLAAIVHACIKHNRVDGLDHGGGQIRAHPAGNVQLVDDRVGGEDLGAALAAEEDAALVEYAQTFSFAAAGRPVADLQRHAVEKAHVDGIEPTVEGDRLDVGVDVQQFRRAALDHLAPGQKLLRGRGGIKAQILHAVLVAAGIENFPCVDAYGFPDVVQVADRAGHDSISHLINLP